MGNTVRSQIGRITMLAAAAAAIAGLSGIANSTTAAAPEGDMHWIVAADTVCPADMHWSVELSACVNNTDDMHW